jgi:acylphosphatase
MSPVSRHIHINGIVQGVGFRPFIYNLALDYELKGWVCNSASGVDIEVAGDREKVESFYERILSSAPPLAQIDSIDAKKSYSTQTTGATAIPSSTAPTADRVFPSSKKSPMTGPRRPCRDLRCAKTAGMSTKIHATGASTHNR